MSQSANCQSTRHGSLRRRFARTLRGRFLMVAKHCFTFLGDGIHMFLLALVGECVRLGHRFHPKQKTAAIGNS